jgi:hypothetical protein
MEEVRVVNYLIVIMSCAVNCCVYGFQHGHWEAALGISLLG